GDRLPRGRRTGPRGVRPAGRRPAPPPLNSPYSKGPCTMSTLKTITHWIGGKPVEAVSRRRGPVVNPAPRAPEQQGGFSTVDEVDAAVASAKAAFETWGASSLARRTAILFKYRELLDAHRDEIAELITAEHGKVHSDALGEVARGMEIVELACGISVQLK